MADPARVLILNERDPTHPRAGGAEIHVSETFRRLAARGHEITLAVTGYGDAPEREVVDGMHVWRLGRIREYYPKVVWTCARETRRGRFDLVVECLNKLPFLSPAYSAVPVLAINHHLFGEVAFQQVAWPIAAGVWCAERAIPLLYRRVPFVSISESSKDDLIARGISADHVRVIHCGIRRPDVAIPPTKDRRPRVVYVGRLERYKRVDVMLRAIAELSARLPGIEAVIVGRGEDRTRLERLADELGIGAITRFAGFVSDAERDQLVSAARVCVCPSPKEGWGLTVIEANAVGTPVVATDAPGLRDSVRDGETGFLVPEGEVSAFANRIALLLHDDDRFSAMSEAARDWSRGFDWDRAADAMEESLDAARRPS